MTIYLDEKDVEKFVTEMANDNTISSKRWDKKLQHVWDDIFYHNDIAIKEGRKMKLRDLAKSHGTVVYELYHRYFD